MAYLIFKLRGVPDDEAEDIRQLVSSEKVDFYETDAGNWGISMPGIWLNNESDVPHIKRKIEVYQNERAIQKRAEYLAQVDSGQNRTLIDKFKDRPLPTLGILIFCAFIVYFSIKPFLNLIELTK